MICIHWFPFVCVSVVMIFAAFVLVSSSRVIKMLSIQHHMACDTLKGVIEVIQDSDIHPNTHHRISLVLEKFGAVEQ